MLYLARSQAQPSGEVNNGHGPDSLFFVLASESTEEPPQVRSHLQRVLSNISVGSYSYRSLVTTLVKRSALYTFT